MNYGDLKTQIADWLNRSDVETQIPDFIRLAEGEIYRDLRCRENEFVVTYDNTSAAGEHILLPENFKEMKRITWGDRLLRNVSDAEIAARLQNNTDTITTVFAVVERKLVLSAGIDNDPANWGDSKLVLTYWGTESLDSLPVWQTPTNPVDSGPTEATETALTQTDTNTTRLLQMAPDLYLAASLKYAYMYLQDWPAATAWGSQMKPKIHELNRESKRAEFAGSINQVSNTYEEPHYTYSRGSN